MFTRATALTIDETQKQQLEAWARAGTTPQRVARKCQAILLASQGVSNHSIAQQTGLSRRTVLATRAAFGRGGFEALRQPQKRKRYRERESDGALPAPPSRPRVRQVPARTGKGSTARSGYPPRRGQLQHPQERGRPALAEAPEAPPLPRSFHPHQ